MKSYHIAAYTFRSEECCASCIADWAEKSLKEDFKYSESMITDVILGDSLEYDAGFVAQDSEILLARLADELHIDISDPYSWDSSDFPKIIFAESFEVNERCPLCHEWIL